MTKLRGIDVSEFQKEMDFSPYDFVIVRASFGSGCYDKMRKVHADNAVRQGKLLAFYHYAYPNFNDYPSDEVNTFLAATESWRGKCLYALDWEGDAVKESAEWAYDFLRQLEGKTGIVPLFYTFAAEAVKSKYRQLAARYPLWLAQTGVNAPDKTVWGNKPTMWQYAHKPYDFDEFYGTRYDWERWAKGGDDMTQADFDGMMANWLDRQAKKTVSPWAEKSLESMKFRGLMAGDPDGNMRPASYVTREEMAVVLDKLS